MPKKCSYAKMKLQHKCHYGKYATFYVVLCVFLQFCGLFIYTAASPDICKEYCIRRHNDINSKRNTSADIGLNPLLNYKPNVHYGNNNDFK